jgi:rhodanese-related sulfurtransferase
MRLAWPLAALILLTGLAGGCSRDMFAQEADADALSVKLARETVKGGYQLMTAEELKKALEAPNPPLVVDTMPFEASYKKEHVPGALTFEFPIEPMPEWDAAKTGGKSVQDFEKLLGPDKNRAIVFYCGFVKCTRSDNAAVWAKKLGYLNVSRFPGGIYAWKGRKYPVEAAK